MDAISGLGIGVVNPQEWIDRMRTQCAPNRDAEGMLSKIDCSGPEGIVARLDQNGDGRVDSAELMDSLTRPRFDDIATRLIRHKDVDGDETLSADELRVPEATFDRIDQNDDSAVDKEELVDFLDGSGEHSGTLEPPHGGAVASHAAFNYVAAEVIHHRDRDGDEALSVDEWPVVGSMFSRTDQNGDGEVDQAELVDFLRGVPGGSGVLGPLANKSVRIAPVRDDEGTGESEGILSLLDEDQDERAVSEQATTFLPKASAYERIAAMLAAQAEVNTASLLL